MRLLDLLYPPKCALCEALGSPNPCPECRAEMVAATPFSLDGLDSVTAAYSYESRAAQAVRKLKYNRATSLGGFMSEELGHLWSGNLESKYDLCVPIPIHWRRRAHRGFNQSEILCEAIGANKVSKALVRSRWTTPQVRLSRDQRTSNLKGAFRAVQPVAGQRVLLVDDVATTGSTARECANTLRTAGATKVGLLVFAQEV